MCEYNCGAESGGIRYDSLGKHLMLIAVLFAISVGSHAAEKNSAAPEFSLPTQSNSSISLSELQGKTILVNFWASWCKPCQKEIPELIKIHNKYKNQGLELIGINIDQEKQNAVSLIEKFNINYTVAFDPNMTAINKYKAVGMPCSFIIDRNGIIREIVYGFSESKKQLIESKITRLLMEQSEI